jgi:rhodanese-related sulfurtransferase
VLAERIDVDQAYELYNQGTFTLDVRTVEEWQQAHIPGATLIPLDELAERYQELPGDEPILIYCRSGNRSFQALTVLKGLGLENLSSMEGGINDWIAAGYPIE